MREIEFKPDAIAVGPSTIKIMVGDKVLQASGVKLHVGHDQDTKDSGAWEQPISKSWDITGHAMSGPKDGMRDFILGVMPDKFDVTIGQEVGKLPRKMKKALHSKRMTKWKHKVASYISRRQVRIHDAEMVVTPDQFDTLKATISGGTIEHGCVVSGKQISEALERYKHRHG